MGSNMMLRSGVVWSWMAMGEGKIRRHWKNETPDLIVRVFPPEDSYTSWYVVTFVKQNQEEFEYSRETATEAFILAARHARATALMLI